MDSIDELTDINVNKNLPVRKIPPVEALKSKLALPSGRMPRENYPKMVCHDACEPAIIWL